MQVIVNWSETASAQYWDLSPDLQESAGNVAIAIAQSPRVGTVFRRVQRGSEEVEVRVFYGLRVRVLYTLGADGRHLVVEIEDVQPSDLPSLTEYEEGEEQRRSRPPWRGGRRRRDRH